MDPDERAGRVLRIFEATAKPGCADALLERFGTTSVDVVRGEPGNEGYFFGRSVQPDRDRDVVMFVSVWTDLDAIRHRFGTAWQESHLPPGYAELVESCSIRHVDVGAGWQVGDRSDRIGGDVAG